MNLTWSVIAGDLSTMNLDINRVEGNFRRWRFDLGLDLDRPLEAELAAKLEII